MPFAATMRSPSALSTAWRSASDRVSSHNSWTVTASKPSSMPMAPPICAATEMPATSTPGAASMAARMAANAESSSTEASCSAQPGCGLSYATGTWRVASGSPSEATSSTLVACVPKSTPITASRLTVSPSYSSRSSWPAANSANRAASYSSKLSMPQRWLHDTHGSQ